METNKKIILQFQDVNKTFKMEDQSFVALNKINLSVYQGELIGLSGKSGSGKTTLLNVAGLIDAPSSGKLLVKGKNIKDFSDLELSNIRAQDIGFIFQTFNLLPLLTALENVEYPLMLLNQTEAQRKVRAMDALKIVGLEDFMNRTPGQLSGGQRQRVAIARAIVKNPSLILADEPTANLDTKTSDEIFELLLKLHREMNMTVMLCSHDNDLIDRTHRKIKISDGAILSDSQNDTIGGL